MRRLRDAGRGGGIASTGSVGGVKLVMDAIGTSPIIPGTDAFDSLYGLMRCCDRSRSSARDIRTLLTACSCSTGCVEAGANGVGRACSFGKVISELIDGAGTRSNSPVRWSATSKSFSILVLLDCP